MKLGFVLLICLSAVACTPAKKPGDLDASYFSESSAQPSGAQTAASMIKPITGRIH